MTKQEIYQALADGKATNVQRFSKILNRWEYMTDDVCLIDWLSLDHRVDESTYRLKPEFGRVGGDGTKNKTTKSWVDYGASAASTAALYRKGLKPWIIPNRRSGDRIVGGKAKKVQVTLTVEEVEE